MAEHKKENKTSISDTKMVACLNGHLCPKRTKIKVLNEKVENDFRLVRVISWLNMCSVGHVGPSEY